MLDLSSENIILNRHELNKKEALLKLGDFLISKGFAKEGYEKGMLEREGISSTYLGNGIAIPHGTPSSRSLVNKTGIVLFHFPEGIPWTANGDKAYLVLGITANSEEHLTILKKISKILGQEGIEEAIKRVSSVDDILDLFEENTRESWEFSPLDIKEESLSKDINSLKLNALARISEIGNIPIEIILESLKKDPVPLGEGFWLFETNFSIPSLLNLILLKESFMYKNEIVKTFVTINSFQENDLLKNLEKLLENKKNLKASSSWNKDRWFNYFNIGNEKEENEEYLVEDIILKNEHGLHTRPSSSLVKLLKPFPNEILIANLNEKTDFVKANSLMKLVSLGAKEGDTLRFKIKGENSQEIMKKIQEAFENKLGEK